MTIMGVGEAWAAEPDMEARDPNNLNEHLKVSSKVLKHLGFGTVIEILIE